MFGRTGGSSKRGQEPQRHASALETLTCSVCGAGPFVECDIIAHQEYANGRYPCPVCGAEVGEICAANCQAADMLLRILLVGVTPDDVVPHAAA